MNPSSGICLTLLVPSPSGALPSHLFYLDEESRISKLFSCLLPVLSKADLFLTHLCKRKCIAISPNQMV